MEKRVFVEAGKPLAVMGSATKDMVREADALVVAPDATWGNPLFADAALNKGNFHIHACLTLDEVGGTGVSFLLGGHYHGKEAFRAEPKQGIKGMADGGWPVNFGFLPDQGDLRIHEFRAEGCFAGEEMDHIDVWSMGHDGYWTYRIPSLCVTPKGSLLAFAEARRFDFTRWDWRATPKPDEVHTVMKRSPDGGETWSDQAVVLYERDGYRRLSFARFAFR